MRPQSVLLFNIVLGMNHIFEWCLKEKTLDQARKLECIKKINPFSSPYDVWNDFKNLYRQLPEFPKTNEYQEVIRRLCNKAKHFKQTAIEKRSKTYTAVCGAENMQCGNLDSVCGGFRYAYSVDINGEDRDLTEILTHQIESWSNFTNGTVREHR